MKTTYIYCPRCKRVHERMPERRIGQDLASPSSSFVRPNDRHDRHRRHRRLRHDPHRFDSVYGVV